MPDNSIDIFYADSVFEHFLPDEADVIYNEIANKLKNNAFVFLIIPNKHIGPHDISKRYLSMGQKAQGIHFMEMSFNEATMRLKKCNINHLLCAFRLWKHKEICVKSKLVLGIKLKLEHAIAKIPVKTLRKMCFIFGGYNIYLMIKGE
jgi:hypothetical protein